MIDIQDPYLLHFPYESTINNPFSKLCSLMASNISFFLVFLIIFILKTPNLAQTQQLLFNGFKNIGNNNLSLNGNAQIQKNGILQLTNTTRRLFGHAFTPTPIRVKKSFNSKVYSFSSIFAFAIVPQFQTLGGHGFAFTFVPTTNLSGALPSQFLGLLNPSDNGNFSNHIFAVEFDEVQDFEFRDINDNHVGVNINSMISNVSATAAYFVDGKATAQNITMKSKQTIKCWIDYDSGKNELNVTLSPFDKKPYRSLISYNVDLTPYFDEFMYVGFSASTGLLASSHYVMGWSFKMNGLDATPLDLSSLPKLPKTEKTNFGMVLGVSLSSVFLFFIAIGVGVYLVWWYKNRDVIESWELNVGPHRFPYSELKEATKGFKEKQLLGFGGFGRVYKGTLPKSKVDVAVKRISHESRQGLPEFVAEIASIGRLRHRNLVQLLGWCRRRGDLILVYDYMPNGSLDKYLFDNPKIILNWEQRFRIIKGVASGLLYLHEEWEQTVIHRDIKAGNVLLDSEFNGRLGDFGLAKLYEHGSNAGTTRVVGTLGYLAPEVTRMGKPMPSSDVFAFGALILEVACGRRPIDPKKTPEELILVDYVWSKWNEGGIFDVMDDNLKGEYNEVEASIVLKLGIICSAEDYEARPSMRQVVRYLEGEVALPETVPTPGKIKKGARNGAGEFEDFVHSYSASSYMDNEGGSVSLSMLSLTGGDEGR